MTSQRRGLPLASGLATTFLLLGCSRGPEPVVPPKYDPGGTASRAMQQYDADGDGVMSAQEAEKAPSLLAAWKRLDANGDGKATRDEIAARVENWIESQIGIMSADCTVTLDGKPLAGAEVLYVPEDFLGGGVLTARGKTDEHGRATLQISGELRGAQCGFYLVKISKRDAASKETLLARYNEKTELGTELASDASYDGAPVFALRSR